jgi:hypothetical protein
MKKVQMIMATTHVDLHNECLTPEALEDAVEQLKHNYVPINYNHDIRYPPLGRVVSAEVIKLPDGEYALQATGELFEESDSPHKLAGDGREIPTSSVETQTFHIQFDRTFRDEDGQELVDRLHKLSESVEKPAEFIKKALEPIQVLLIASGIYIVGSIAKGFLSKLGSDIYEKLRDTLIAYYRNKTPESILDFCFYVKEGARRVEVHVLLVNPTVENVSELLQSNFAELDEILSSLPLQKSNVSQVVLEYKNKELSVRYAVRNDSVPLHFVKKVKKDGSGS